jgi:hypothetical protein
LKGEIVDLIPCSGGLLPASSLTAMILDGGREMRRLFRQHAAELEGNSQLARVDFAQLANLGR